MRSVRDLTRDSGAAMIEFALVVPILLALIMGILDFGRAINYWIDETHLANEAARFAAVGRNPGGSGQTLQQWIRAQAVSKELREGSDSVTDPVEVCLTFPNGATVGEPLQVEVRATYSWMPFLRADTTLTSREIVGKATMRLEAREDDFETGLAAGCA